MLLFAALKLSTIFCQPTPSDAVSQLQWTTVYAVPLAGAAAAAGAVVGATVGAAAVVAAGADVAAGAEVAAGADVAAGAEVAAGALVGAAGATVAAGGVDELHAASNPATPSPRPRVPVVRRNNRRLTALTGLRDVIQNLLFRSPPSNAAQTRSNYDDVARGSPLDPRLAPIRGLLYITDVSDFDTFEWAQYKAGEDACQPAICPTLGSRDCGWDALPAPRSAEPVGSGSGYSPEPRSPPASSLRGRACAKPIWRSSSAWGERRSARRAASLLAKDCSSTNTIGGQASGSRPRASSPSFTSCARRWRACASG